MGDSNADAGVRLDSWKAIADYLSRDVATVRRWEKSLGLPVRRVPGGRGASVFAYTVEIDAWLKTRDVAAPAPVAPKVWRSVAFAMAVAAIGTTAALAWRARVPPARAEQLRVDVNLEGVVARTDGGAIKWTYPFSTAYKTGAIADTSSLVVGGAHPAVYFATAFRARRSDELIESGTLVSLDLDGRPQHSFSFTDEVTFHGMKYGAPWVITSFSVDGRDGERRIAIAAHHYVWGASIVTVLDDKWQRRGTFVHAGWIETVRWLTPDRLLIAGFSNAHDGGMLALLDAAALDGQGPEPEGSLHYCERCGRARPVRMVILPRTEVNRATASRFNRARIQVTPGRILARTEEFAGDAQNVVDAIYEFTPSLDVLSASFSDRYRETRHALEIQGKVPRKSAHATDDRPGEIQVWEPQAGWQTRKTP